MSTTNDIINNDQEQLLKAIGVTVTDPAERQAIAADLVTHFQELILETVIQRLSAEQAEAFRQAVASQGDPSEAIEKITAAIPGLAADIELAVDKELVVIRGAYESVS